MADLVTSMLKAPTRLLVTRRTPFCGRPTLMRITCQPSRDLGSHQSAFCRPALSRATRRSPAQRRVARTHTRALVVTQQAALTATAVGAVLFTAAGFFSSKQQGTQGGQGMPAPAPGASAASGQQGAEPKDAVLVFGATGALGRALVKRLLAEGRDVVAAVRDEERTREALGGAGGKGGLTIRGGADVTKREALSAALFAGVSQLAVAVGPVRGQVSSEQVDAQGVGNVVAAAAEAFPLGQEEEELTTVVPLATEEDVAKWEPLNDVIMGGSSSSELTLAPGGGGAVWKGTLVTEGGGFCGNRLRARLDLGAYEGLSLRVRGDGQTFKVNVKTAFQEDTAEATYQQTFDTVPGEWTRVHLPWRQFIAVNRARTDPAAPPLDSSKIRQLGLVLSRFEFNGVANTRHHPGPFQLEVDGGVAAYRSAPAPRVVLISSGGVERNARIGGDEAARKRDIPIVQLNPDGILNHKYTGEMALRNSGLAYTVVRPVGLTREDADTEFLLEASQGDRISGKITREEVASVVAAALATPQAAGKTLEVRRSEAEDARGARPSRADLQRLFLGAVEDRLRVTRALPPLPSPTPVPPPPSKERLAEILGDSRVQAAAQREKERSSRSQNGSGSANGSSGNGAGQAVQREEVPAR